MRELTSHKVNGLNEALKIEVRDEPGAGNACHYYHVSGFVVGQNPAFNEIGRASCRERVSSPV